MPTDKYRISSNEVIKISTRTPPDPFDDRDVVIFGVLTTAAHPDGTSIFDPEDDPPIPRKLGFAKHADVGGNIVRNATQAEIDTWPAAELDDDNQQDADRARDFRNHKQFGKRDKAFADIMKNEFNTLRARQMQLQADVAAAGSLLDLKAAVAAYPALNPRTLTQLEDAIEARISKDD